MSCPRRGTSMPSSRSVGETEGMLLVHRRDVVEPVEIGHRLQIGLMLDQLLRAAMEEADMRVDALDDLAVELKHQTQHAMRGRVLRAEVDVEVADVGFSHHAFPAFSSPGSTYSVPSQGERKSKLRNSWGSFTGS